METRANYVQIGVFTLAVVAAAFGFVYWFQSLGGHVERSYYRVVFSGSVGGLMDAAPEPEVLERIRILVSESATGAIEAHDLRTRVAGRLTFLDFHLVVPATMTVAESHDICDRIEARLQEEMDHLVVTIHVEPDHKAKQQGVRIV